MLFLLIISILPVILIGTYIYTHDKEKEPIGLLIGIFAAGISSIYLAIFLERLVGLFFPGDPNQMGILTLAIYSFVGIALIEEGCKWAITFFTTYKNREFNHVYDAIVYCVFTSLGFAGVENILYVIGIAQSKSMLAGLEVGIQRAIISVPGHACFAIIMGYFYGLAKIASVNGNKNRATKYLVLSLLMPSIAHAFFDFCLFSGYTILVYLFYGFVIGLYIYSIYRVKKLSKVRHNIVNPQVQQINFCSRCGSKVNGRFCGVCGKRIY